MANIGSTSFYIGVPSLPADEFQEYSSDVFDEWESFVTRTLQIPDYSLALDVEEGSIKGVAKVGALLGAVYIGIGQYGSFISGLQTIDRQIRTAGDYLSRASEKPFENRRVKAKVQKRGESLAQLQTLFIKVQKGQISVEQAMKETEDIFGSEIDDAPGFMDDLKTALNNVPQQIYLPFDATELKELRTNPKTSTRKTRKPREPAPPSEHYRIEVWRDSRSSKKNVKLVQF